MKMYNAVQRTHWFRHALLLPVLFLIQSFLPAQVTVSGSLGADGAYATLSAAFTQLNAFTHTGAVITVVISGNTVEPGTATLNSNAWTYLTIAPAGGAARTVSGNVAGPLVDFNGADRIGIDGINSGGNSLTFDNTNTGAASTIRFIADARVIGIQRVTLKGANTSTTSGTVFFSTGTVAGNDSIAIQNSTIMESGAAFPVNAVYSAGTATAGVENSSNQISDCFIQNYFNAALVTSGIQLAAGNTQWVISGNRFFQTAPRTYTTGNIHPAIRVSSGDGYTLSGNIIGYSTSAGTGTYTMTGTIATRFIAIDLAVGTGTATSVQGNTFTAFSLTTSSGATTTNGIICGINIASGNVNAGTVTPNIIGGSSGTGLITSTSTTSQGLVTGFNCSSTGTVNISNNIIGGLSSLGSTATQAGNVRGINVSGGAASITISGNTIGNGDANNMRAGTVGTTTGASIACGIFMVSTPTSVTLSNNLIQNFASYGTGTSYVRGIQTATTTSFTSVWTISGNTIHDLTTNGAFNGIGSGQCSAQGIHFLAAVGTTVSGNTVYNISNTNTGGGNFVVAGIAVAGSTVTTTLGTSVFNNRVYGLSNSGTGITTTAPPVIAGIVIRSGNATTSVYNNMISLGTGVTANPVIIGIWSNNGSAPNPTSSNIWYNTVTIEGTAAAGAMPTFGYHRGDFSVTTRTVTIQLRNNILNNNRTGGTSQNFAIGDNFNASSSAIGWTAGASDYNVLNSPVSGTVGFWTGAQTFAGWQTASASDVSSYSAVPVTFVSASSDLHLNFGITPTVIESGGTTIAGVSVDYDAQTRPGPAGSTLGGAVFPDIGADEIDAAPNDIKAPLINYSPLTFTCSTGDRSFTATLTDVAGVPTSGSLRPKVYYRKNAGLWYSSYGTLTSGTSQTGTWTFTIVAADMGGLAGSDIISYFVIAQDIVSPTPNIGSNPSAGLVATDVNTVTTPPATPNTYPISGTLSGTYTVGTAGAYTTLSAAVAAYNSSCLSGPVVFTLLDATYPSETFPITIQANPDASAVNTLTIKPAAGVSSVFTGSSATAILIINGADYITLDGHNGTTVNSVCPRIHASRDLFFENTNLSATSGVLSIQTNGADGATNNTIQNCGVRGSGPLATLVGVNISGPSIGAGTGSNGNNNNQVINNKIDRVQVGVFSGSSGSPVNTGNIFNLNEMNSPAANGIGRIGVAVLYENNTIVHANTIANIVNAGTLDVGGITLGYVTIGNTSNTGATVNNASVMYNVVDSIVQTNTFSAIGIAIASTTSGTSEIANNMVSNVHCNGTSPDFACGIFSGGGSGTLKIWHNTVSIAGGTLAGANQPAVGIGVNGSTPVTDIRNNIVSVTAVSGYNGNTGIGLGYSSTPGAYVNLLSNYNDIYVSGTGSCVGRTGSLAPAGVARTTLADWQTETGADMNSVIIMPVFASADDAHLNYAASAALSNLGTPIAGVSSDIDCNTRDVFAPDMGADEFCATALAGSVLPGDTSSCTPDSLTIWADAYSFASGSGYSWEVSPSGAGTFTATGGTDPDGYFTGTVVSPLDFRLAVTCATDGSIAYTDTLTLFIGDSTAPLALCSSLSITLDASGSIVIPDDTLDGGSTDNCASSLTFTASQTSFSCGDLGAVAVILTADDGNGNTDTCTATVTVASPLMSVTIAADTVSPGIHISCAGDSSGSASVSVTGGCPGYTYMWSSGGTGAIESGLPAGTYTVTVSEAGGQSDTLTVTLNEPSSAMSASSVSTMETCVPGSDGAVDLTVSGGTPGYTYLWSNSATTQDISGLNAGSYTVTVTDSLGCIFILTDVVSPSPGPGIPVITQSNDTLFSSITDPTYTYQWYMAGSPLAGETGTFLQTTTDGSYTVIVTDTNGCSDTSMVYLYVGQAQAQTTSKPELWPNPASNSVFLKLPESRGIASFRITDMFGRSLLERESATPGETYEIDVRGWSTGMYLVESFAEGKRSLQRLIIE